jgi:CxxC motif-containing protein (DUF1111 family)
MKSIARCLLAYMAATVAVVTPSMLTADPLDAAAGKALFDRQWVPAPASTNSADGLGPLFTARSCAACHRGGDGSYVVRGEDGLADIQGVVVRFGREDGTTDPTYGLELQTHAVPGLDPEGSAHFLPGLSYTLKGPPLAEGIKVGVRLAPSLFGRAAFDDVPDDEILKRADHDDRDGDGISGRANRTAHGIGRYGWKAAQVTLRDQIAHAFAFDIGLSSPRYPLPYGDCTDLQKECLAAANGESPGFDGREVSGAMLDLVAAYLRTVPARPKAADAEAAALFEATGCARCHVPTLRTRDGRQIPAFTDLLLHDMGAELNDGVGEPGVRPSEWRTAPLIAGHTQPEGAKVRRYLHDGSAQTVAEAVAKHGGEAARSRDLFASLKPEDRKRLVEYVNGL